MELILKIDVEGVGFKDDLVNVKNGFGRNFLIPNGSAVLATSSAKKVLAENLKQRAFKEKKIIDDANKLSKKLLNKKSIILHYMFFRLKIGTDQKKKLITYLTYLKTFS